MLVVAHLAVALDSTRHGFIVKLCGRERSAVGDKISKDAQVFLLYTL